MPENDFLYALREDVPDDFKQQLKQQLDAQEPEVTPVRTRHTAWWTVAVASIVTLILSVGILVNNRHVLPFMKPLISQSDLINPNMISNHNLNQLEVINSIGRYAYDIATYKDKVIIGTSQGIFEHEAANLNAEPRLLVEDTAIDIAVDGQGNVFFQQSSATYDQVPIFRWDRQTNEIHQVQELSLSIVAPDSLYVSEDGRSLYISECILNTPDDVPYIDCAWQLNGYQVDSGEQFVSHRLNSSVARIAQSRNGKSLVYFKYDLPDANLYLNYVNLNTGDTATLMKTPYNPDYQQWITSSTRLALSDDGKTLLVGHPSISTVNLWDMDELIQLEELPGVFDKSNLMSFSLREDGQTRFDPTGNFLIQTGDWGWYIFDLRDDVMVDVHRIRAKAFTAIDFANGGQIALGMYQGIIFAYDTGTWEQREILTDYTGSGDTISFTADGQTLMTDQIPVIWDLSSDPPQPTILSHLLNRVHQMRHAVISPKGEYVAYQTYDSSPVSYGRIFVKNLATNIPYQVGELITPMAHMQFLPDNTLLIVSENGVIYQVPPEKLEVEEDKPYTITEIDSVKLKMNIQRNVPDITFTPDGTLAALWDCQSYNPLQRQCETFTLNVWDIPAAASIIKVDDPLFKQIGTLAFSADGQQLAVSFCTDVREFDDYLTECESSQMRIYNVEQLREGTQIDPFATFKTEDGAVALTYHPIQQDDGSFILAMTTLSTDDGMTQFWSVSTSGQTEFLYSDPELHTPFVFNPQGDMIVTQWLDVWGLPIDN